MNFAVMSLCFWRNIWILLLCCVRKPRGWQVWHISLMCLSNLMSSTYYSTGGSHTSLKSVTKLKDSPKSLNYEREISAEWDFSCFQLLDAHLATTDAASAPVVICPTSAVISVSIFRTLNKSHQCWIVWGAHWLWVATTFQQGPKSIWWIFHVIVEWKITFAKKTLMGFWCDVEKEYHELWIYALFELLPFGSTYMCKVTFSALNRIKTKQRNRLMWRTAC